jgi:hypothetical protein
VDQEEDVTSSTGAFQAAVIVAVENAASLIDLSNRGCLDREDVKGDKEREYYLGHSVKALAGRWQKGASVAF